MCGICGVRSDKWNALHSTQLMVDALRHRGPDDHGVFVSGDIALGHTRLSIIDLAGGHQPIFSEDRSVVLIFNGEIYNYKDLRRELETKGHQFCSHTDSEVIIHLYEQEGIDCLQKFNGMFAFALYDSRRDVLLLARDRVGIKPLYYYWYNGIFTFSSEIQALTRIPEIRKGLTLNHHAIWHYFSLLYIPSPLTVYNEIAALPPAHYLWLERGYLKLDCYWKPNIHRKQWADIDQCADELDALITDSVRLHMQSDVPYGAYLSGGVDSSLIVTAMAGQSEGPVKTFTVRVCDDELDEGPFAREIVERYQTVQHWLEVDMIDTELLTNLILRFGQPFADSSLIPTYLISQKIRSAVKVALGGDGGDELFAGYNKYDRVLQPRTTESSPSPVELAFFRVPTPEKRRIFSDDFLGTTPEDTFEFVCHLCYSEPRNDFDLLRQLDLRVFLESDILTKVDVMSMANSLEARVPLLDHRIVEFGWQLPQDYLVANGRKKVLLKHLLARTMSEAFVNRPKVGLMLPVNRWVEGPVEEMYQAALTSPKLAQTGCFNREGLQQVLQEHLRSEKDMGYLIFAIVVFYLWYEHQEG